MHTPRHPDKTTVQRLFLRNLEARTSDGTHRAISSLRYRDLRQRRSKRKVCNTLQPKSPAFYEYGLPLACTNFSVPVPARLRVPPLDPVAKKILTRTPSRSLRRYTRLTSEPRISCQSNHPLAVTAEKPFRASGARRVQCPKTPVRSEVRGQDRDTKSIQAATYCQDWLSTCRVAGRLLSVCRTQASTQAVPIA